MKYSKTLIIASVLAVAGCAPSGNTRVENTYGDSVRSMIHNQIADPQAAANPDEDPVPGYSGPKGEEVLGVHTDNVSKTTESTNNDITLNIGK